MQNRFEFLEDQIPKLAGYGKNAEEALNSDNNICLLNLGRIAETITETLCRVNNVEKFSDLSKSIDELVRLEIIDEDISLKLKTLIEIKNDAEENNYDSETACERLMTTAHDLCEWFVLKEVENKFEFLAELYPPDFIPPLINLAELGREAEQNLFTNTRYCLICLGDVGEAIVDYLITANNVSAQRDHLDRINVLFNLGVIHDETKDALHNLRISRNNAVHERYNNTYTSEEEASLLLEDVLNLCRWIYKIVLKPGYIVKGKIAEIKEDSISVLLGSIPAEVPLEQIPEDLSADGQNEKGSLKNSYIKGKKYLFKVLENDNGKIILSLREADENYKSKVQEIKRKYSQYNLGQELKAKIIRISNSTGAFVELKNGLPALIPPSEIVGRKLYSIDASGTKHVKFDVVARVKYINPKKYPPMQLTLRDLPAKKAKTETTQLPKMKDLAFISLCKNAGPDKILDAIDKKNADPNAKNSNKFTALMEAAQYNNPSVIKILLEAGAEVNAKNKEGNTALHFAAMQNSHDAIEELINGGADINALNKKKHKPVFYARSNKKLNDYPYIIELLAEKKTQEPEPVAEPENLSTPAPEKIEEKTPPTPPADEIVQPVAINLTLMNAVRTGTPEEVLELINNGADVNYRNQTLNTPLHLAAQHNNSETAKILLENGAEINAKNDNEETPLHLAIQPNRDNLEIIKTLLAYQPDVNVKSRPLGNTALHFAAGLRNENNSEVCIELIKSGALNIKNNRGVTPLEIANRRGLTTVVNNLLQKNFLRTCRSGSSTEIAEAIAAGVNVNVKNKELRTALMFAALYNTAEAVSYLIEAGAYIDAQDIYGRTALIYAASRNTDDVVELLIDAGAELELKDTSGFSAYDYGRKNYRLADTEALKRLVGEN